MREPPKNLPAPFGRYRLLKLLGQGGMGTVYLAHDSQLDRSVALKIPLISEEEGQQHLERFYREARAAAALHHPNICPVHDVGEIDGLPYMTMAYIDGKPLADFAAGPKPLAPRQCALLVRKLALALAEAHKRGVIHRDLKPSNVMIDKRSEPVVMDFGLARRARSGDPRLTQLGSLLGTPSYMPPEQVSGDPDAMGPASDIYSLGVVLYELLAGRLPFEGDIMALLSHVLLDEPPPPSQFRAGIDPELEGICLKAMAKKIPDRYASMTDFAGALAEHLRGSTQTGAPLPATPSRPIPAPTPIPAAANAPTQKPGINLSAMGGLRSVAQIAAQTPPRKARPTAPRRRPKAAKRRRVPLWVWIVGSAGSAAVVTLVVAGLITWEVTNYGDIRVQTTEPASKVQLKIDGVPRDWGEKLELRAGLHQLEATGDGFVPINEPLTISRGHNSGHHVEFQSLSVASTSLGKAEEIRQIQWKGTSTIYSVAISSDNRYYLATGDPDKTCVWSVETGLEIREFRGFISDFTSDGKQLVVGSRPKATFFIYHSGTWNLDSQFKGEDDLDFNCWVLPKTDHVVTATKSGYHLWTLKGEERGHWKCDPSKSEFVFTPDGKHILLRLNGAPWRAIDVATRTEAPGYAALAGFAHLSGFTSDGKQVYVASANKLVYYDVKTGAAKKTLDFGDAAVEAAALSADDKRVLTAHTDHTVRLWDVATGHELWRVSVPELNIYRSTGRAIAISADGKYACAGGAPGRVYLWRLP
jgi:WD40 repeat protein/predicted Ser/Thr protein kinase